ncbi:DUF6461 domain-containing protein [Virgisporangium aurantiacum]|uniref:Uncharacterized protein n=1 Tax=Virgisporangium aurantiacum TaxID=175570 RepID=A0A8J3Z823_9ACTN|nr:DUF6461 domain-containing protein [Virgisporangium aurantiacum]GIJ56633.1 hypothetical protein Vau01_041490 [Virgisporangium aurantiacum]
MTSDLIEYYRQFLADRWDIGEAVCISYVQGIDEAAMIRAFGGDPADTAPRSAREAGAEFAVSRYDYAVPPVLLVAPAGKWLIGVEYNGFEGSRPEVLRGASAGGTAVSVHRSMNGSDRFTYATNGRTTVWFDMNRPEDRHGAAPDALGAHLDDLPFGSGGDAYAAGLALAERITGVRLTGAVLDGTFRRAVLRSVDADLVPEGVAGHPALDEPFVRAVLAEPTVDKIPGINRYLAEAVARDAGITDVPEIRAALDALRAGTSDPALRQDVQDLAERYRQGLGEGREPLGRVHAASGVAAALDPDPVKGSLELFSAAGYALHTRDYQVQHAVLGRCTTRAIRQR